MQSQPSSSSYSRPRSSRRPNLRPYGNSCYPNFQPRPLYPVQQQGGFSPWLLPWPPSFYAEELDWLNSRPVPINPPYFLPDLASAFMGAPSFHVPGFVAWGYYDRQHYFPYEFNFNHPFNHFPNSYTDTWASALQDQNYVNTREALSKQIEYYFSDANLVKDTFLRSKMDNEGWVSVNLIANFPRVKRLTDDRKLVLKALESSTIVEVKEFKMRRRDNWEAWILPDGYGASISTYSNPHGSSCSRSPTPNMLVARVENLKLDGDSSTEPVEIKSETILS